MSVLFLTYCYPPLKYPRSVQISHLVQYLKDYVHITIICSEAKKNTDKSLLSFTPLDNVVIAKKTWWTSFIENIKGDRIKKAILPDSQYLWSFDLYQKALEEIKKGKIQTIVSFGQPMSSHLAGLRLKKRFPNLKWVAHFSDPWIDNPYNEYNAWLRFMNKKYQDQVFSVADKLLFTSPETIDTVTKSYSIKIQNKASYLPHAFNPLLYSTITKVDSEAFTLRYLGNFYGDRKPDPLLKALCYLKDKSVLANKIRVELVGVDSDIQCLINKYQLESLVYVKPAISYLDSLALMVQTDLLLIIDAPTKRNVFFPSKLADYIGSNRPIFGITPPGTSQKIIESLGFLTASPDNPEEVASKLFEMIEQVRINAIHMNKDVREQYAVNVIGNEIRRIL